MLLGLVQNLDLALLIIISHFSIKNWISDLQLILLQYYYTIIVFLDLFYIT